MPEAWWGIRSTAYTVNMTGIAQRQLEAWLGHSVHCLDCTHAWHCTETIRGMVGYSEHCLHCTHASHCIESTTGMAEAWWGYSSFNKSLPNNIYYSCLKKSTLNNLKLALAELNIKTTPAALQQAKTGNMQLTLDHSIPMF